MVERLKRKHQDALRAIGALKEILQEPFSIIVRDAAIQRFEFTFEALWKFLKEYLKEQEGIISNSPKACFRELFSLGLLSDSETITFLEMTDDRNMTSHTYKEEVSQIIFAKLPAYSHSIINLMNRIHL
jgi:nucleotidyltransferase substrate binding protein (TIGR01987 family)